MASLNHMHKGHCSHFTILKVAAVSSTIILPLPPNQPFDQITSTNTTELAASVNTVDRTLSSDTTDGTAKTLLKLVELITRNRGHSAPLSQRILDPPGPYPVADVDPPSQTWTPYQTFLLSIVCIVFGNQFYLQAFCRSSFRSQHHITQ